MARTCEEDSNPAEFIIINGDYTSVFCSVCFAENVADLVKSNDTVTFRQSLDKQDGLTVITLG